MKRIKQPIGVFGYYEIAHFVAAEGKNNNEN